MKLQSIKLLSLGLVTALGVSSCEKDEDNETGSSSSMMMSTEFNYEFNNGQVASSSFYDGDHPDNLMAKMMVTELPGDSSEITVTLMNTMNGEMYMIHAHDAADASTTPNGTPYNETPNSMVFTKMLTGNGNTVSVSQKTAMSYEDITMDYEGFFVVHDPTQSLSTTDISTYVIVGSFARESESDLMNMEYNYDFNTGQVAAAYAYSGTHANDLMGKLKIQELSNGESRVSVWLMNSMNGQTYMIHAHDGADATMTPNGTPYDETPNSNVLTKMAMGNGGTVYVSQTSTMSYMNLTTMYNGFFVVHDPLQSIDTTDPTTYVLLGSFAR